MGFGPPGLLDANESTCALVATSSVDCGMNLQLRRLVPLVAKSSVKLCCGLGRETIEGSKHCAYRGLPAAYRGATARRGIGRRCGVESEGSPLAKGWVSPEARGEGSPRMADIRFALRSAGQIPAAAPPPFGGAGCTPATGTCCCASPRHYSRGYSGGIATSAQECW